MYSWVKVLADVKDADALRRSGMVALRDAGKAENDRSTRSRVGRTF